MGTNKTEEEIMKMEAEKNEQEQETTPPKRRKSRIKKTRTSSPPSPPAPLPFPMMQTIHEMEGKDQIFILGKILEWSDTAAAENRFLVPKSEVLWSQV